ncbi:ferritin-like protein, partial [Moorena sp. SIO2C4]|uniref:ferritin-like domain-containing protein n=1 Tax=Moorena sp. SIO2C4 TaxID=2607824 RepID=UPI0013C9432A
MKIKQLMLENPPVKGEWTKTQLIDYLKAALLLEYTTIPPYLLAFWSLKRGSNYNDPGHIYTALRNHIQQEEMLHMGLVCNLIVGLCGTVDLTSPGCHPTYPTSLVFGPPEQGNESAFLVSLRGYSEEALQGFLNIEYPKGDLIPIGNDPDPMAKISGKQLQLAQQNADTIGEFYEIIKEAFKELFDNKLIKELNPENQLEHFFDKKKITRLSKIQTKQDVINAIDLITRQGEGAEGSLIDTGPDDL